jgi:hypothetical protein
MALADSVMFSHSHWTGAHQAASPADESEARGVLRVQLTRVVLMAWHAAQRVTSHSHHEGTTVQKQESEAFVI